VKFTVRPATAEDATTIARVHVDSWRSTYAGMLPEKMLLKLSSAWHETRWWRHVLVRFRHKHIVYVAEYDADGVVGFGSAGAARDHNLPYRGEIYALYLLDAYHGAGIGKALMGALSADLSSSRGLSMVVWVLGSNPSRFFYEAIGGQRVATRVDRKGGVEVEEIAYGWDDVSTLVTLGSPGGAE